MRNVKIILGAIAVAAVGFGGGAAAIGMTTRNVVTQTPPTTVASQSATPAVVVNTVTVSGTGKITAHPDTASLSVGVQVTDSTATAALNRANKSATALITALKAAGVADDDLATTGLQVYPQYAYPNNKVSGYQASNGLTVTIRDITKVGPVIDAAAAAAGPDVTIGGVSFFIGDQEKVIGAARSDAIANAKIRAGQYATAAGRSIGNVVQISEVSVSPLPVYEFAASADADKASTPIQPGTQDLSVSVTVVFAMT